MKVISYFKRVLLAALGLSKAESAAAPLVASARIIEVAPRPVATPAPVSVTDSTATVLAMPLQAAARGFMLPARLASVSKLNTKAGRVPHNLGARRQGQTPLPAARLGAKRQRTGGAIHVPSQRKLARKSAIIIPFPTRTANATAVGNVALAEAA